MALIEPEALSLNGWTFYEKCRCNRILKWKYRNPLFPDLELQWLVSYFQFKIMNKNTTKIGLTAISHLDAVLKSLK